MAQSQPYTYAQCIAAASAAGFADPQTPCGIMQGESSLDPNVPCTCSSFENTHNPAAWIHGFEECLTAKLTPACGLAQWQTTTGPQLYANQGCVGDLKCELDAMFRLSNGGQCYSPWAGNAAAEATGKTGNCDLGSLAGFTETGGGGANYVQGIGGNCGTPECKACTSYNPLTYNDCLTCFTSGCGSPTGGNPLGIPGQVGSLIGDLLNPKTWLNVGLVIAGFVTVMLGINAVLSGAPAKAARNNAYKAAAAA